MRVVLLVLGVVNLVLVGMVAAQNHHLTEIIQARTPAEPITPPPPNPIAVRDTVAERKQVVAARQLQEELAGVRQELTALRSAIVALDTRSGQGRQDVQTEIKTIAAKVDKVADAAERITKTPNSPATDARQLKALTDELKKLNAQFKRIIDFAGVR